LGDPDDGVRTEAARALGVWGDKDSVTALIRGLSDDSVFTRRQIITTLGRLKDARAAEPLARQLGEFFYGKAASEALQNLGPAAEASVLNYVGHPDASVRQEACKILAAIGTKASLPTLRLAVNQKRDMKLAWAANEAGIAILRREDPAKAESPEDRKPDDPAEAGKLAKELPTAAETRQQEIIRRLLEGKGAEFTQALADSIPKLSGVARDRARTALGERLARMSTKTLQGYLREGEPELRRAAVAAVVRKSSRELVPDIIPLLREDDVELARTAHEALKELIGLAYDFPKDGSPAGRKALADRWQKWWQTNGEKP
jgi:HEAT repeat protein